MRAAVRKQSGDSPFMDDFADPTPQDGAVLIDIETTSLGGWDIVGAYRLGVVYPCVVRGEGVGRTEDGRRVYFGERSVNPWGAWAERTVVPAEEVWDVPDDIDDRTAITLGIAATGAIVPLEQAQIQEGESVLVTGATGALGQVALQLARRLGAGRVVAASRDTQAVAGLVSRGLADAGATMGNGVDADADTLRETSGGDGFDVVLDVVYGEPFVSALRATRFGARIMTIGAQAGMTAPVNCGDMLYRTHTTVGTGQRPAADREQIWRRLLDMHRSEPFVVDYREFGFEDAAEAWAAQASMPRAKIVATVPR